MTTSDQNYLHNVYGSVVARYIWSAPQTFTLTQWKSSTGLDLNSKASYFQWAYPTDNSFILKNPTNSTVIIPLVGTIDLDNVAVSSATIPPYSSKVLINFIPLPVELLSFKGQQIGLEHLLSWESISEINTQQFEVQRLESGQYKTVVTLPAKGEAAVYNANLKVSFNESKLERVYYYRLRILDLNGAINYSNVISIENKPVVKVEVYPNPAAEVLYIQTNNSETAKIFNIYGQVVQTLRITPPLQMLDISAFSSGVYWLKGASWSRKFTKF